MSVVQIAVTEPISLQDAKEWLNIDYDDQDSIIDSIIKAARLKIERRCGVSIALKQYRVKLSEFGDTIEFPMHPIVSIDAISYIDLSGDEQEIDPSVYTLIEGDEPYIYPLEPWPLDVATRPDAVSVEFTSGIDIEDSPPDEVPDDLLQAMRLEIGAMFENREQEILVPTRQEMMLLANGVPQLIAPYIVPRL